MPALRKDKGLGMVEAPLVPAVTPSAPAPVAPLAPPVDAMTASLNAFKKTGAVIGAYLPDAPAFLTPKFHPNGPFAPAPVVPLAPAAPVDYQTGGAPGMGHYPGAPSGAVLPPGKPLRHLINGAMTPRTTPLRPPTPTSITVGVRG